MKMRKVPAILAATVLTFGLAACGGGGQSVDEACKVAEKEITAIDFEDDALSPEAVSQQMKSAVNKVKNKEVKSAVSDLSDVFTELADIYKKIEGDDVELEEMDTVFEDLEKMMVEVEEIGERLESLCGFKVDE